MNTSIFEKNNKKDGGFIQLIILIIIALLLLKYYGVTITQALNWFQSYFASVLK